MDIEHDIQERINAINTELWRLESERRRLAELKSELHGLQGLAQLGRETISIQTGVEQ